MRNLILFIILSASFLSLHAQKSKNNFKLNTSEDSLIYALGVLYFEAISSELIEKFEIPINTENFIRGIQDTSNGNSLFDRNESNTIIGSYLSRKESEYANVEKESGEKFLSENQKRAEIIVTSSGLQYEIMTQGTGEKPILENMVKVHYTGSLIDGTRFDSSVERGEPVEFTLNEVIIGWQEGLQLMPVGSRYKFYMPSKLAYGTSGAGMIKPNAVLIFEIELLEILN